MRYAQQVQVTGTREGPQGAADPGQVLADAMARLLEPATPPRPAAVAAAAEESLAVLRETRQAVPDLIGRTQAAR